MNNLEKILPFADKGNFLKVLFGAICWGAYLIFVNFLFPLIEAQKKGAKDYTNLGIFLIILMVSIGFLLIHWMGRGCDIGGQYKFGTYGHLIKLFSFFGLVWAWAEIFRGNWIKKYPEVQVNIFLNLIR